MRCCWNAPPYQRGLGVDKEEEEKRGEKTLLPLITSFSLPPSPFTTPPLPPSFHCKWVWSLSDVIQLISLRFNYKCKHPSYPSPLDRGSTFSNKLPLVSQESLNYRFYSCFYPASLPLVCSSPAFWPFFTCGFAALLPSARVHPVKSSDIPSNLFDGGSCKKWPLI